jgi:hypothetical protein
MDVTCFLCVSLGSSTVHLHDSLADAHAHVQSLVSVVKMATVLEGCITKEQLSVVRFFCGQRGSMIRVSIKKYFSFTVGSVCRVKRFKTGGKYFADEEQVETDVRKWLRQQSKSSMLRVSKHW